MEFALLDLPDELIVHIIGHIEDPKTLANLACTSRQMYDLAIPPLYREILIANPKDVQALDLALKRRPQWASAVQKLEVPSNPGLSPHLATISGLITKMTNLRHLLIESPMVNCGVGENFEGNEKEWNAVADPLIAPFSLSSMIRRTEPSVKCLQNLKSFTLHLNGPQSPYWDISGRNVSIFFHPTLEKLHISCMNFNMKPMPFHSGPKWCTPLKHLIFEECNITPGGLERILMLPKALETLYLGENCHNHRQFSAPIPAAANQLFDNRNPQSMVQVLSNQSRSLKSLTYATDPDYLPGVLSARPTHEVSSADGLFSKFEKLEKVHLIGASINFERAMFSGNHPPNLKELIIEGMNTLWINAAPASEEETKADALIKNTPFLRIPSPTFPKSLPEIRMIYTDDGVLSPHLSPSILSTISSLAESVKKAFGLTLSLDYKQRHRYFPPYLYGEPLPVQGPMFDGETRKFAEGFEQRLQRQSNPTRRWRILMQEREDEFGAGSDGDESDGSEYVV